MEISNEHRLTEVEARSKSNTKRLDELELHAKVIVVGNARRGVDNLVAIARLGERQAQVLRHRAPIGVCHEQALRIIRRIAVRDDALDIAAMQKRIDEIKENHA